MRIQTIQLLAVLVAAIAFTLAFIAAGAVLLSFLFAAIGAMAVAWLAYMIAARLLTHRRHKDVSRSVRTDTQASA